MGILLCKDGKVERLPSLSAALGAGSPGSVPGPATGPSAFVQGAVPSLDPRPEPPSKLKPRWSLVPMEPLGEVAWLLTLEPWSIPMKAGSLGPGTPTWTRPGGTWPLGNRAPGWTGNPASRT